MGKKVKFSSRLPQHGEIISGNQSSFLIAVLQNRYTVWIILVVMGINLSSFMLIYNPGGFPSNSYILSHYLLSYELSFMPRALIGTIYQAVLNLISVRAFFWLLLFFQVILYFFITIRFFRCIARNGFASGGVLLFFTYLLFPSIYLYFFDFGRLDIFLLFLAVAALLLIRSRRSAALLMIPLMIWLGIMIHEAFMLFYVPTLFAWSFFDVEMDNKRTWLLPASVILGSVVGLGLLFLMRQNMPGGDMIGSYIVQRNQITHTAGHELSIALYAGEGPRARSYFEHLLYMVELMKTPIFSNLIVSWTAFLACMPLPVYIFWKFYDHGKDRLEKIKIALLFLTALSPLALCIIAYDFGRWFSAAMWCLYLTGFLLIGHYKELRIEISWKLAVYQFILFLVLCKSINTELVFCRF